MVETQQSEPVTLILKAPLTWLRIAALVLAVLAMSLPAVAMSAFGDEVSTNLTAMAGWLLLFPLVLVVAVAAPGVPALGPYGKLLDLLAAALGVVAVIYLLFNMNMPFGPLGDEMGAGLGLGAYALFLAALLAIAVVALPTRYLPWVKS